MELSEEKSGGAYLLYVPSTYDQARSWPLVVVCHGTWPYDTAELQMREWARFGENEGIIVVAPTLEATRGDFPPPPERQIALQRADETLILNTVLALRRQYNIADERVFMTGWSAGSYSILHTGLRNPDVFRAMYVRQGTFDERFMDVPEDRLDRWQAIKIVYGKTDLLRDQAKLCITWLREHGLFVDEEEIAGAHRRIDPKLPWDYFKETAKRRLWVRLRAIVPNPDEPLTVRFELDSIPPAVKQKWFFGDGKDSYETSPVHTYERPGRYEVTANVQLNGGKKYARKRMFDFGR